MSELSIELPVASSAEHIPAALAAPKPKRVKPKASFDAVPADAFTPAVPVTADPIPSLPTAAAPAEQPSEEPTMTDTMQTMGETFADTATAKTEALMGDMGARAQSAMNKGAALFADWNSFNRGNVEALVESSKLAMSGLSTMAQDRAAYVRKQMEDATAAVRTMTSAKSPTEFAKLQGDFVREQFDAMVAETSRSTEAALKLAGEIAQPLSNRFALAAEKVRNAA